MRTIKKAETRCQQREPLVRPRSVLDSLRYVPSTPMPRRILATIRSGGLTVWFRLLPDWPSSPPIVVPGPDRPTATVRLHELRGWRHPQPRHVLEAGPRTAHPGPVSGQPAWDASAHPLYPDSASIVARSGNDQRTAQVLSAGTSSGSALAAATGAPVQSMTFNGTERSREAEI